MMIDGLIKAKTNPNLDGVKSSDLNFSDKYLCFRVKQFEYRPILFYTSTKKAVENTRNPMNVGVRIRK